MWKLGGGRERRIAQEIGKQFISRHSEKQETTSTFGEL